MARRLGPLRKYGFLWVTAILFVLALAGQWYYSWQVYEDEQEAHGEPVDVSGYVDTTMKDMLENWQSEFLQLIWQVAGLAFLLHIGSPQSKEGDERKEAKLDALLEKAYGEKQAKEIKAELETRFPSK